MTCKNCIHWKSSTKPKFAYFNTWFIAEFLNDNKMGLVSAEDEQRNVMEYAIKYCVCPKLMFNKLPSDSGAVVVDSEWGYKGALLTAENFGCINFESSEDM